ADGQPAIGPLGEVRADLEPELVDVEVEGLLLVEDVDRSDVEPGQHWRFLLRVCRWEQRSGYGAGAAPASPKLLDCVARSAGVSMPAHTRGPRAPLRTQLGATIGPCPSR